MCGIAAILSLKDRNQIDNPEARLLQMLGVISHRGDPYHFAERKLFSGGAMGTNRLAIVDRKRGKQPFADSTTNQIIIMNGEIYNHILIRKLLVNIGHVFQTDSDTEVVLRAYSEWGENCVTRFDGIFGFVIFNPLTKDCFAARDHIGIKPLYYCMDGGTVLFASELKCFLDHAEGAREMLPGHIWHNHKISKYWEIKSSKKESFSIKDSSRKCKTLLESAVKKQVDTDLPIAVIFSGGLDSTVILHLANKFHEHVTAFSIGTEESEDLTFAKRFCRENRIPHIVTIFEHDRIHRLIEKSVYYGEFFEPIDISDMLSMSAVFSTVLANGFKVALSGDGSDEIFAGYDLFQKVENPYELAIYRVNNLYRTDLQRTDRASMSNSIECRVPFLDKDLVSFAMSLPMEHKIYEGIEKYVLRQAFRDELPDYMINRPKIRMPEGIGINNEIFNALSEIPLGSPSNSPDFLIDSPQVQNALQLYLSFGFDLPKKRYKQKGLDYFEGGYFNFG